MRFDVVNQEYQYEKVKLKLNIRLKPDLPFIQGHFERLSSCEEKSDSSYVFVWP